MYKEVQKLQTNIKPDDPALQEVLGSNIYNLTREETRAVASAFLPATKAETFSVKEKGNNPQNSEVLPSDLWPLYVYHFDYGGYEPPPYLKPTGKAGTSRKNKYETLDAEGKAAWASEVQDKLVELREYAIEGNVEQFLRLVHLYFPLQRMMAWWRGKEDSKWQLVLFVSLFMPAHSSNHCCQ